MLSHRQAKVSWVERCAFANRYLIGLAAIALALAACSGDEEAVDLAVGVQAEPAPAQPDQPADVETVVDDGDVEPVKDTQPSEGDEVDDDVEPVDDESTDESTDDDVVESGSPDVSNASTLAEGMIIQRFSTPFVPAITLPDVSVLSETGSIVEASLGDFAAQGTGIEVLGAECVADGGELVYSGSDGAGSFFDVATDGSGTYELVHGDNGNVTVTVGADGSGSYQLVHGDQGNIEIQVDSQGAGLYKHIFGAQGNLEIAVGPDGTGTYTLIHGDEGNIEIQIATDGSGFYRQLVGPDGNIDLVVNADGTGSYDHVFSSVGNLSVVVNADGSRLYQQIHGPNGTVDIVVNADGSGTFSHFNSDAGNIDIEVDSDGNGTYRQVFGPNGNIDTSFTTTIGILDPQLLVIDNEPTFAVADRFPPLASLASLQPPCATVVRFDANVLFDFDSAELRPDAAPVVAELAQALIETGQVLEVHGHTDSVGDDSYNLDLSERRAAAFAMALVEQGVQAEIVTIGFGETRPAAPNHTADGADDPAGRQLNRRIEVVIGG